MDRIATPCGELYQGGSVDLSDAEADITLVVNVCAYELCPARRGRSLPLEDCEINEFMQRRLMTYLAPTAIICADILRSGGRVVSICNMGRNRSGLVNGLILRRLGVDDDAAVAAIRAARAGALSNQSFVAMIRTAT